MAQLFGIFASLFLSVACSKTYQTGTGMGEVEKSGFLGEYSMLRPSKEGEATLIDRKHEDDHGRWGSYTQILLEPVRSVARSL